MLVNHGCTCVCDCVCVTFSLSRVHVCLVSSGLGVYSLRINESPTVPLREKEQH